jgi:hypothetical protein
MKNYFRIAPIALMTLMISCGGGDPSGTTIVPEPPGGSTNLVGGFTPDDPNPGAGTVSMSQGGMTSGDVVMVQVNVTGIDNLFGVSFDIVYNPALADFLGHYPGTVMETGGLTGHYLFSEHQAGVIVSGVTRPQGTVGGVDVGATQELVTLAFQVTGAGSSTISFQNFSCEDENQQIIQGLSWAGGTLTAN